jgi:tetratricopeptide (TPR) repeat protein
LANIEPNLSINAISLFTAIGFNSRTKTSLAKVHNKNPADAYAWAALADAYITYGHSATATKDVRQEANAAALQAIQLDSTLAEAWYVLGIVKAYYEWEWEAAEQAYLKANELNPSLPMNHFHYSWYLILFGRMNEAIREHKLAQELDPFGPIHTGWLAALYAGVGEYEKAIKEAERTIDMGYEFFGKDQLAEIYIQMGREHEGLEIKEQLVADFGAPKSSLISPYIKVGRIEEAREIFKEVESKFDSIPSPGEAWDRAWMYLDFGDYDNVFKWFNYEPHMHWVPWGVRYIQDSLFVKDPRYKALLRKMNLPDPAPPQYDPELEL